MLERMKHEKTVDIYGHVTCMRSQRNYMVQTEDQYIFIHEALLEAATCGNTEVPARNLFAHLQKLSQVPLGESVTAMELEFKVSEQASMPPPEIPWLGPCWCQAVRLSRTPESSQQLALGMEGGNLIVLGIMVLLFISKPGSSC